MCICVFFLFTLHLEEGDIERRFKKKKMEKEKKEGVETQKRRVYTSRTYTTRTPKIITHSKKKMSFYCQHVLLDRHVSSLVNGRIRTTTKKKERRYSSKEGNLQSSRT